MWFECDQQALVVSKLDGCQRDLLDAVPLTFSVGAPALPVMAKLAVRRTNEDDLTRRLKAAASRCTTRLQLSSPPEVGTETIILLGEVEAHMALPGQALATLSGDRRGAEVQVADPTTLAAQAITAAAALTLLAEAGYYAVHSSLAQTDGTGVMFLGARSRGKTSSALALGKAGWTILADDRCYVHGPEESLQVWGPGGRLRLRPDAPQLWDDVAEPMRQGGRWGLKAIVEAADLAVAAATGSIAPQALFFPQVVGTGKHVITPLKRSEALAETLASTGLALLPEQAARQFQAVATLVRTADCYRLQLGRDMASLADTIGEVLR